VHQHVNGLVAGLKAKWLDAKASSQETGGGPQGSAGGEGGEESEGDPVVRGAHGARRYVWAEVDGTVKGKRLSSSSATADADGRWEVAIELNSLVHALFSSRGVEAVGACVDSEGLPGGKEEEEEEEEEEEDDEESESGEAGQGRGASAAGGKGRGASAAGAASLLKKPRAPSDGSSSLAASSGGRGGRLAIQVELLANQQKMMAELQAS
jgi:hypothetical protein